MAEEKKTDAYITSKLPEPEKSLTLQARDALKGKKCLGGRYLTKDEAEAMGWGYRPFAIFFEGDLIIYASSDDEGNEAGALFTTSEDMPVIPVIS